MFFQNTISPLPFKNWIIQDKENKRLLLISIIIALISFGWIKYLYPFPNFMPPDSYNYLEAAQNNDFINIWPIGYSKFLRLFSVITRSQIALVFCQYTFLISSILYFLFSIRYFFSPSIWLFRVIFIVSVFNPILIHIANFVSSDALFAALSFIWFTHLLWIIYRPTNPLLIIHSAVIFLAFTVRLTGIYYPLISIALILVRKMPAKNRRLGIGTLALPVLIFIGCTQNEYAEKTGLAQISAFGGWQLAANALYGYAYDQPDNIETVPAKFRALHNRVNQHMDSIRHLSIRPDSELGVYYQWNFKSPLLQYLKDRSKSPRKSYFQHWASVAPLYGDYGRWLVIKHPVSFLHHYIWPNIKRYYAPPPYFMGSYIMGYETVEPIAVSWFQLKTKHLSVRTKDRKIHIMTLYTTILSIINPAFLISYFFFNFFSGFKYLNQFHKRLLLCLLFVWLANMLFSVFSAPIELRYQIFPTAIIIPFIIFFINWISKTIKIEPVEKNQERVTLKPLT
jgi:hypothetical protein